MKNFIMPFLFMLSFFAGAQSPGFYDNTTSGADIITMLSTVYGEVVECSSDLVGLAFTYDAQDYLCLRYGNSQEFQATITAYTDVSQAVTQYSGFMPEGPGYMAAIGYIDGYQLLIVDSGNGGALLLGAP